MRKDQTWDDFHERDKWLHWNEFCDAVTKAQQTFEDTKTSRACHDALLLTLFRYLPGRAGEARLLQYMEDSEIQTMKRPQQSLRDWVRAQHINLVTKRRSDAKWLIVCGNFKTLKSAGVDVTELDQEQHAPLIRLLELWICKYRTELSKGVASHHYVFMSRKGQPFSSAYFSAFLAKRLHKMTGQHVSANGLHSSFITYFYGSDAAANQQLRESVAQVTRHSVSEAQRTYDRRNAVQKKHRGMMEIADDNS